MIRSMTGFGEAAATTAAGTLRIELRTVNHRYLNVNTRLPAALSRFENDIREWLRDPFSRGHVNCTVRLEPGENGSPAHAYRLDEERVANYLALFQELADRFGVTGQPDLPLVTRFNDIIVRNDDDAEAVEIDPAELRDVLLKAGEQAVRMREEEGKRLEADLRLRVDAMEEALGRIEALAPERLVRERKRLQQAVTELLDGRQVDEQRVAQEIALLAERWDVTEELVRFRSHNELFIELLDAASTEPVGKRLSFLVQEMHREANTIGSKANDADIAHLVVTIKDELERLREQVENVE